ncbi:hypothetical protein COB64_03930 [Candidatus Wolfebacteria bacterium]|nr:MAG: hypothetical protein COB64_03930 [Candidatus Wolfebacteria bacterium]
MNKTVKQRRQFVEKDHDKLAMTRQCRLLNIYRSGLYYRPVKASEEELTLMLLMDKLHLMDPTMGTRRMSRQLKRMGYQAGREKVRRLMRIMRIKTVYCRPRTTVIDPARYKYPYLLRNLDITEANKAWAVDITYIPMKKGFMYLCAIIDLYSRYIVSWSVSNSMEAEWVVGVVKDAIKRHGKPEILNSDQGSQFTSDEYIGHLKDEGIKISMDGKGRATDNAHIERFWRTIKYDKLYMEPVNDGLDLYEKCKYFINYYNKVRGHSSIDYCPPIELYKNAA